MRRTYPAPKAPHSAALQYTRLGHSSICPGVGRLRRDRLRWEFEARPTPIGRTYRFRLSYRLGHAPEVVVLDPDLPSLAGGRALPHVYSQTPPKLCLYLPGSGEWSPDMLLVDTIVPWSYLWLFYFEDWLATGAWKGGGAHPQGVE